MKEKIDMLSFEREASAQGFSLICGVDEAGRGPLAGPVCAAAVILPPGEIIDGVDDSKKLSEKRREQLFPIIKEKALAYATAFSYEDEIDEFNILNATFLAMKRAVQALSIRPDFILVDGNRDPHFDIPSKTIVKGDSRSLSIAAASVLAKVTRDHYMLEIDEKYPQYDFARHKGYGTKAHYEAILKYGISPVHRRSFLKNLGEKHENK